MTSGQISIELTTKAGIAVHALMPVKISEPADKAKNIVGKLEVKLSIKTLDLILDSKIKLKFGELLLGDVFRLLELDPRRAHP